MRGICSRHSDVDVLKPATAAASQFGARDRVTLLLRSVFTRHRSQPRYRAMPANSNSFNRHTGDTFVFRRIIRIPAVTGSSPSCDFTEKAGHGREVVGQWHLCQESNTRFIETRIYRDRIL